MLTALLLVAVSGQTPAPPQEGCADVDVTYGRAVDALASGLGAEALSLLEDVLARCPTHPSARALARVATRQVELTVRRVGEGGARRGESTSPFAHAELAAFQGLHGFAQGLAFSAATSQFGPLPVVYGVIGSVVGVAGSLLLTPHGVTHGEALTTNSATAWSVWILGASTAAFFPQALSSPGVVLVYQLTTLTLTLAGGALAANLSPPAGRISLMNSGGFWSAVVAALFLSTSAVPSSQARFGVIFGASVLGGAGGLLLGEVVPMSRARALIIDFGGVLGFAVGVGLSLAISPEPSRPLVPGVAMASVTVCGLALAGVLTRDMDLPRLPPLSLAPLGPQGSPGFSLGMAF
ncbi:MAG: hypothetical protein L0Y66_07515 [Myxococcaceae bacterium]|nr:hypothetical protein [Myxococcaceae bacterium]MCI0670323.1 hypothetical protein [Myxococcaceae bacterium]